MENKKRLLVLTIASLFFVVLLVSLFLLRENPVITYIPVYISEQGRKNKIQQGVQQYMNSELYESCTAESFDEEEFRFILEQRFPQFSELSFSLGEQPQFDSNGNFIGDVVQTTDAISVLLSRARILGLSDPRILAVLIEVETQGLSFPNGSPQFPLNEPVSLERTDDPFVAQVTDVLGRMQYSRTVLNTESFDSSVLVAYFVDKYEDPDVMSKIQGESGFRTVFTDIFVVDPVECQQ